MTSRISDGTYRAIGSWHDWSKVHTSNNIMFACKIWNLATDIMQGIVFGNRIKETDNDGSFDAHAWTLTKHLLQLLTAFVVNQSLVIV